MLFRGVIFLSFLFCALHAEEELDPKIQEQLEQEKMESLKHWIEEQQPIRIRANNGHLLIGGEVRTEYQAKNEKRNGIQQRGSSGETDRSFNEFDIEVNFMLDYRAERTWASVRIEFDNDMGIESGSTNHLALEKAFFGGRVIAGDTFTWDIELGRRFLYNVFDSRIEFGARYDGLLFRFGKAFESIGDYYTLLGTLLVDDRTDHFAYAGEMGLLRIAHTGFLTKYSLIWWKKQDNTHPKNLRYNFINSQFLIGYEFTTSGDNLVKFYAAGLLNHAAKKLAITNNKRFNYAFYAGVSVGIIRGKGDYALDINYQYVAPQAIPSFDNNGIGRGNAQGVGLYTTRLNGGGSPTTQETATGNANYKGFQFELLYAITDRLTILQNLQLSQNMTKEVGPLLKYRKFEVEFIYTF